MYIFIHGIYCNEIIYIYTHTFIRSRKTYRGYKVGQVIFLGSTCNHTFWMVYGWLDQVYLWGTRWCPTVISWLTTPLYYSLYCMRIWTCICSIEQYSYIHICYINIPLTMSITKRVNKCLIPSPVSWRIHATKWSRALVFVVRGRVLHLVAAFHLALKKRKCIL